METNTNPKCVTRTAHRFQTLSPWSNAITIKIEVGIRRLDAFCISLDGCKDMSTRCWRQFHHPFHWAIESGIFAPS
eukprot:395535-Amphidinium_carterae.1